VRNRNYRNEMTGSDAHRALAEALRCCTATVVLSGYESELYDVELYPDWYRVTLGSASSQGGTWKPKTEVLWSNRPLRTAAADQPQQSIARPRGSRDGCNETAGVRNETRCRSCGRNTEQAATGRRRQYCSPACRVRAHRLRRKAS
jgi:DNA adenine methylase